jgi:hypothetical protein
VSELALIPPFCLHSAYSKPGYHLFLPQLLRHAAYREYVRAASKNSFTILDNGAFEGDDIDQTALIDLAVMLGVNEVVIPDTLGDKDTTLVQARSFGEELMIREGQTLPEGYMAVVQGETLNECIECLEGFTKHDFITTFGLPKHLVRTVGTGTRHSLTKYIIEEMDPYYAIHYLGSSPLWLDEITHVADDVRGMDTSMPFVQAYHRRLVDDNGNVGLERPTNYFEGKEWEFKCDIVEYNVRTMRKWSSGSDNTRQHWK